MQADVARQHNAGGYCSAERRELIFWLRVIGSTTYRAKLAAPRR